MKKLSLKAIALIAICVSLAPEIKAQVMGNGSAGSSSPKEVKSGDVNSNSSSSDVSLSKGTFGTNHTLGTISTPSGLSYSLELSYSSSAMGGDNVPITKGIP